MKRSALNRFLAHYIEVRPMLHDVKLCMAYYFNSLEIRKKISMYNIHNRAIIRCNLHVFYKNIKHLEKDFIFFLNRLYFHFA